MRLLAITSNRVCYQNAATYLRAIREFKKRFAEEIKLVVVGDGVQNVDKENKEGINKIRELESENISFIAREEQTAWIDELINSTGIVEKNKIRRMLNPDVGVCSYGAALNRLFLIAVSNNIEFVHKRDSDTRLNAENVDNIPLLVEAKYLGAPYSAVENNALHPDMKMCFVGSNYTGDPPADLMPLYDKDPMLFYRYNALTHPSSSIEEVIELVKSRYFSKSNKENLIELVDEPIIELGNCSYYKIFNYYPVSTAQDTMGTDYFIQDLMSAFGLKSLFHPKTVEHIHDKYRKTRNATIEYHLRFPAFKIYNHVLHFFYKEIAKENLEIRTFDDLPSNEIIAKKLISFLDTYKDKTEIQNLLKELSSIYIESEIADYIYIGEKINQNREDIINRTFIDLYDFAHLISQWHKLVAAAEINPFKSTTFN